MVRTIEPPLVNQVTYRLPERGAGIHVQSDRGLIEEQQLRPATDRHGELHLALLTAGEILVATSGQALERQALDHGVDLIGRRVITCHCSMSSRGFMDGDSATSCIMMPMRRRAPISCGSWPNSSALPRVRALQSQQNVDGGGFAGAVGSKQREQLAASDGQVQLVECRDAAKALDGRNSDWRAWLRTWILPGTERDDPGIPRGGAVVRVSRPC